jgi:hypothetical protein
MDVEVNTEVSRSLLTLVHIMYLLLFLFLLAQRSQQVLCLGFERGLKTLPNEFRVIIIKINLTMNYQLLVNCNKVHMAITSEVNNSSIKQVDDSVRPKMIILTAAQAMTDKSNHHMLVQEGKSAKSMSSTKLWSKSKTSNNITSQREGLVETEYSLRNNYCSVQASDKVWWVVALSHVQELEKDVRVYGSPHFCRVMIFTLAPKADCCVIVGIYTGLENHVITAIMSQASLNAQIVKLFGGIVLIIILERISNIQERQPASSTARNLESPMHPTSKK